MMRALLLLALALCAAQAAPIRGGRKLLQGNSDAARARNSGNTILVGFRASVREADSDSLVARYAAKKLEQITTSLEGYNIYLVEVPPGLLVADAHRKMQQENPDQVVYTELNEMLYHQGKPEDTGNGNGNANGLNDAGTAGKPGTDASGKPGGPKQPAPLPSSPVLASNPASPLPVQQPSSPAPATSLPLRTPAFVSNDFYTTSASPGLWGMAGAATSPITNTAGGSNAAQAWANGYGDCSGVVVGVIDEGIQYTHPDLVNAMWVNSGEIPNNGVDDDGNGYVDDVYGFDFTTNTGANVYVAGGDAHGTHVSGTIGGTGGNGQGVAGVCFKGVKIVSGKFLGPTGGNTANAVKAIDYMIKLKNSGVNIKVLSNSWGGGGFSQTLLDAIKRADAAGMLFVAAAGNGGSDGVGDNNDAVANYPSNYDAPNVVAVAALTSSGGLASYSNYGSVQVDIGAPGSNIVSSVPDNAYSYYAGTSMATPHVSGAAALYWSLSWNAGKTPAQVRAALLASAKPTASLSGKTVSGGRLDVWALLQQGYTA